MKWNNKYESQALVVEGLNYEEINHPIRQITIINSSSIRIFLAPHI
jgi:hypothetical protein